MERDEKLQCHYNQMFDLVSKRMHNVSILEIIQALGYHFIYMLGIAHRLDSVRAENYEKVLNRGLRWVQSGQNSEQSVCR